MRLSKESQEFNSWVLGGAYSKTTMKRHQIKADLELTRKAEEEEDDTFQKRLEKRREQLKEARSRPVPAYKSKVPLPSRERPLRTQSPDGSHTSPRKRVSPRRHDSPPRPETKDGHEQQSLRERLHQSFAQTTAAHAYGTLFPPLLTPYNRPCNFLRMADRAQTASPPPEPDLSPRETFKPPPVRERFSLAKSDRQRPQPRSGPQAFFPTGSSTTAYRFLANSHYATKVSGAAKAGPPRPTRQGDELNGVLSSTTFKSASSAPNAGTSTSNTPAATEQTQQAH